MGSTWSGDTSVEVFSDLFPHISLDQLFSIHGLHSQTLSLCLYPVGFPDSLNFQGRASEWVGDEEERSPPGQPPGSRTHSRFSPGAWELNCAAGILRNMSIRRNRPS